MVVPSVVTLASFAACGGSVAQQPNDEQQDSGDPGGAKLDDAGDASACWSVDIDANLACVPGVAAANQGLSIALAISDRCPHRVDQCAVAIEGTKISLRLTEVKCPTPQTCPVPVGPDSVQCSIPPLAPGRYEVEAVGEGVRPAFAVRELVVAESGTDTTCYGGTPDGYPNIETAKYPTSCASDDDCIAVRSSNLCVPDPDLALFPKLDPCSCPDGAIAASGRDAYDADYRTFLSRCATPKQGTDCTPCPPVKPTCKKDDGSTTGTCTLIQQPSSP